MEKAQLTSISLDLLNIEKSLKQPQLVALMRDGWDSFSFLPVEDSGRPKLILILKKSEKAKSIGNYSNLMKTMSAFLFLQTVLLSFIVFLLIK